MISGMFAPVKGVTLAGQRISLPPEGAMAKEWPFISDHQPVSVANGMGAPAPGYTGSRTQRLHPLRRADSLMQANDETRALVSSSAGRRRTGAGVNLLRWVEVAEIGGRRPSRPRTHSMSPAWPAAAERERITGLIAV
jgi:hypothetical protein